MNKKWLIICLAALWLPWTGAVAQAESVLQSSPTAGTSKPAKKVHQAKRNRHHHRAHATAPRPSKATATHTSKRHHLRKRHQLVLLQEVDDHLRLGSAKALIINQNDGEVIYAKNPDVPTPIASLTKLMTAMVTVEANLPMEEEISISESDVDTLRRSTSRLPVGTTLTRLETLHLALMASENRAAAALGRTYPGGLTAFVQAMNLKANALGMGHTHFVDSSGLHSENTSTASDLAKMAAAAYGFPLIRELSTAQQQEVTLQGRRHLYRASFHNTNALVRSETWEIGLSKTGYINEAGRCLIMQTRIAGQALIIVLLDAEGKMTRIGDANRIRKWVENSFTKGTAAMRVGFNDTPPREPG